MAGGAYNDFSTSLSRLLAIMAEGERIARDCAIQQAKAANDIRERRFFAAQAMHESLYAQLFESAAKHLASSAQVEANHRDGLQRYARQLIAATTKGHWNELVIGQQLVLENLGELVLKKLDREMARRGMGFKRKRSLVLRQERAHHHFGTQWIDYRLRTGQMSVIDAQDVVERYIGLADGVLDDVSDLLDRVEADAEIYRRQVRERLPDWARSRFI